MIRYVVAVILTVAIVGTGLAGAEYAAGIKSEQQVTAGVADLETAAESLVQNEEVPPAGIEGARRFVTIDMPDRSLTSNPVEFIEFERVPDEDLTVIKYRVDGRANQTETIDAPIANETGGDRLTISGGDTHTFRLSLVGDSDGDPVVKIVRQ